MKISKLFLIFLICIFGFFGCTQANTVDLEEDSESNVTVQHDNKDNEVEGTDQSSKKEYLFDKKESSQEEAPIFKIDGKEYTGLSVKFKFQPYILYIPEFIEVFDFHDGTRVGFTNAQFISLMERDRLNIMEKEPIDRAELLIALIPGGAFSIIDEELAEYHEYIGSHLDENGVREDFFLYGNPNNEKVLVEFRYFEKNKEQILSTFLEIAKTIQYIEE